MFELVAGRLVHCELVILDEVGYLPFSASGGALLFYLLSTLYERTSVVITANLSFSEWTSGRSKAGGGMGAVAGTAFGTGRSLAPTNPARCASSTTRPCRPFNSPCDLLPKNWIVLNLSFPR